MGTCDLPDSEDSKRKGCFSYLFYRKIPGSPRFWPPFSVCLLSSGHTIPNAWLRLPNDTSRLKAIIPPGLSLSRVIRDGGSNAPILPVPVAALGPLRSVPEGLANLL